MHEIGLQLKKQREEKGLTLADIEKSTKISVRLLKSIEAGDFGALPSGVFARNFVRQYCKAIEVPWEPILDRVFTKEPEHTESVDLPEKKSHRGIIAIITVILLVAGGVWGYKQGLWDSPFQAGNTDAKPVMLSSSSTANKAASLPGDEKTAEAKAQQEGEAVGRTGSTKVSSVQPADEKSRKASDIQRAGGLSNISRPEDSQIPDSVAAIEKTGADFPVRFEADEKCWIHLRCPEREMDFILMKGELYTTTCSDPAIISVGNAEHIRVFVDNVKVVFPAGQRVVKDFVLRRKGGRNRD